MKARNSPLLTGREASSNGAQVAPVPRRLVVEAEGAVELRLVARSHQAAVVGEPAQRLRAARASSASGWRIGRRSGLQDERVLDVGEQQLLVLLLVVQAERDELRPVRRRRALAPAAASTPLVDLGR